MFDERHSRTRTPTSRAELRCVRARWQDKWSAVYNVRTILLSIQSLLGGARNTSNFSPGPCSDKVPCLVCTHGRCLLASLCLHHPSQIPIWIAR